MWDGVALALGTDLGSEGLESSPAKSCLSDLVGGNLNLR